MTLKVKWVRSSANGTPIPYYQEKVGGPWSKYTSHPQRKPDIPGHSLGMETFKHLLSLGAEVVKDG
jgi:hypothetical protein